MTKPLGEERKRAYRPRRTFTPQFRAKAVALAMQGTQTLAAIARDLDLNPGLLHNWVRFYREPERAVASRSVQPLANLVEQLKPENLAKFHAGKPKSHHKKPPKETTALTLSSVPTEQALAKVSRGQMALPILEEADQEPCQRLKRVAVRAGLSMQELVNSLMELAMVEGVKGGR